MVAYELTDRIKFWKVHLVFKNEKKTDKEKFSILVENHQDPVCCASLCSTTVVILFVIALRKEFPQLNPDLRKQCQTAATALTKLHLLDAFEYEDHGNMGCQISKGGMKIFLPVFDNFNSQTPFFYIN